MSWTENQIADSRNQFPGTEGFHQIIVGAELKTTHPRRFLAPGRQHDDRHVAPAPDLSVYLPAIDHRKHDVQHDHGRAAVLDMVNGGPPVAGVQHSEALPFQGQANQANQVSHVRVILGDQDKQWSHLAPPTEQMTGQVPSAGIVMDRGADFLGLTKN